MITLDGAIERAIGFLIFPINKKYKILSNSGSLLLREKNSIKNYVSLLAYMRAEKIDASLFPKTLIKNY